MGAALISAAVFAHGFYSFARGQTGTAVDIAHHGVTWLDVLSILVVILFGTGIVGALLQAPRK